MTATAAVRELLAMLPAGVRARLEHISLELRPAPIAIDYGRGATDDQRGYFYGLEYRPAEGTELPNDDQPHGVIVLFTSKIRPYTRGELARTMLHEIGHVLGYDEDQLVHEMGLG